MVSCYLMGGLGNQLFQISTAYALSKEINDDFGVDFNLGHFTQKPASYYSVLYQYINKIDINKQHFDIIYQEPSFSYNPLPYKKNILLKGYFQSEKYFSKYYDSIYQLFINSDIINSLKNKYNFKDSLSIHIRRTDYLTKPNFHTNLSINYYLDAIKYIDLKEQIDKIYVFSDDIEWCKNNLIDNRIIYVENLKDYEELYLMSLCTHNIIANSSFSWWGSYLNLNKNKIVIAPKNWFGRDFGSNWQDIYYKNNVVL